MFSRTSRYVDVPEGRVVDARGREIVYKRLRHIPTPAGFRVHVVARDDRLDRIAFTHFRDPEQFWRLCDANVAMRPDDLTARLGRRLEVPLPR